jgi:hypothetical protein
LAPKTIIRKRIVVTVGYCKLKNASEIPEITIAEIATFSDGSRFGKKVRTFASNRKNITNPIVPVEIVMSRIAL